MYEKQVQEMRDVLQVKKLRRQKRQTVYSKIKSDIAAAIDSGALPPGDLIPSEKELAASYQISRSSVRTALFELEREGLIFKRPGKGTFVKDTTMMMVEEENEPFRTIGVDFYMELGASENWYSSKLLRGMEEVCNAKGCRLSLMRDFDLNQLRPGFIDGYVSTTSMDTDLERIASLTRIGIHPVLINRLSYLEKVSYFSVNYRKEAEKAVGRLVAGGHSSIGLISGPIFPSTSLPRYRGYCDALGLGADVDPGGYCIVPAYESDECYATLIAEYLKKTKLSAIFLTNGCFAVPLKMAAERLGLRLGHDLEVACFDDVGYLTAQLDYPLAYVKMPLREMGRDVAKYLLEKFRCGNELPAMRKLYEAEVVDVN
jgi:GntR family transcriptional regulator of arabinose operon